MAPILPPKEKEGAMTTTSIRLSEALLEDLERIAKETNYSRNEVMVMFLKWARQEYESEKRTQAEVDKARPKK